MKTVTVDILNDKVISLLRELEALHLIRLSDATSQPSHEKSGHKKASDYKGIISSELNEKMQEYIRQSREEW